MKIKKKIYLAGKVTGEDRKKCTEKFRRHEIMLQSEGYKVINPTRLIPENMQWDEAIRWALSVLSNCDAIYLISDWKNSKGAKQEVKFAIENNIRIVTYYDLIVE